MNTPQKIRVGDWVRFLQPWDESEVPDHPTGEGKVLAVFTRGREQWLEIAGRKHWVWAQRVVNVQPAVVQLVRKPFVATRPAA